MTESMKNCWRPISELTDLYTPNLLLCAPELVQEDCNPHGVAPGWWQDDLFTPDGEKPTSDDGAWVCAGFDMTNDEWVRKFCVPTHFMIIEGPEK